MSKTRLALLSVALWVGACDGGRGAGENSDDPDDFGNAGQGSGNAGQGFGNAGEGGRGTLPDGGMVENDCERTVSFAAVSIGDPPPFDVVIIADHSASLSWSRDDLAAGLSSLLAEMRGRSARFFVLTPTQYGASSAQAIDRYTGRSLVLWSDPATDMAFTPEMTLYSEECFDAGGAPFPCPAYERGLPIDYSSEGVWTFVMPEPVAAITAEMTEAEIEAQQQTISDAILSLGGTGSPNEQPLCTLNRYLMQDAGELPEHAVFVVISDEDDATLPQDCAAAYHFKVATTESPHGMSCNEVDCDSYQYLMYQEGLRQPLQFSCVPVDDLGTPHPEDAVAQNTWLNGSLASDCTTPSPSAPCGSDALAWAQESCGGGFIVDPCTSSCELTEVAGCILMTTEDAPDFCNSAFTHEGTTYASMEAYCDVTVGERDWLSCERRGYSAGESRGGTNQVVPLVEGDSIDALIMNARQRADAHFGVGGYFVEVIGFDPSFSCMPQQGQSHATNLRRIATSDLDVFPICGDYAPALDRVRQFAGFLVDLDHELVLQPDERLIAVRAVAADGGERLLDPMRYAYDRASGVLHIVPGALGPTDVSLAVEVERSCDNKVD